MTATRRSRSSSKSISLALRPAAAAFAESRFPLRRRSAGRLFTGVVLLLNYDVIEARYVGGYVIWLRFRDNTSGEIDLEKEYPCHQCSDLSGFFNGTQEDPLKGTARNIDARLSILPRDRDGVLGPWHRRMLRVVDSLVSGDRRSPARQR